MDWSHGKGINNISSSLRSESKADTIYHWNKLVNQIATHNTHTHNHTHTDTHTVNDENQWPLLCSTLLKKTFYIYRINTKTLFFYI